MSYQTVAEHWKTDGNYLSFWKKLPHLRRRQQIDLFIMPEIARGIRCDSALKRDGKELVEGEKRVGLKGEVAVRRGDEVVTRSHAADFLREAELIFPTADVLDDGVGENPFEGGGCEGEAAAIGEHGLETKIRPGFEHFGGEIDDHDFREARIEIQKFAVHARIAADIEEAQPGGRIADNAQEEFRLLRAEFAVDGLNPFEEIVFDVREH